MPTPSNLFDSQHFCTQQYAMANMSDYFPVHQLPAQQQYVHRQETIFTTVSLPHDGEDGDNDGQVNVLSQFQEKSCWCGAKLENYLNCQEDRIQLLAVEVDKICYFHYHYKLYYYFALISTDPEG